MFNIIVREKQFVDEKNNTSDIRCIELKFNKAESNKSKVYDALNFILMPHKGDVSKTALIAYFEDIENLKKTILEGDEAQILGQLDHSLRVITLNNTSYPRDSKLFAFIFAWCLDITTDTFK
ncbi:hypothetical protein [Sphingobacterium chungjuense]|uniref:hypothetical protein n=1 Tax=Sphingobacterium chungjuense TaxID=2675553 RepID=UPI0014094E92|nr:hypothetical protein [Sphingobacterium chungjuense]